jgi:hypothetical protein
LNLFEFLLVIFGIVLGLGIAELLAGTVRILRHDLVAGRLHLLWIVIVFQVQVQLGWALWWFRSIGEWSYGEFVLVLLQPVILYLAAAVLFPSNNGPESLDTHLIRRRRPFFFLIAAYTANNILIDLFVRDVGLLPRETALRVGPILLLLGLANTTRRTVHWVLGLMIFGLALWFTYQFTFVVSVT